MKLILIAVLLLSGCASTKHMQEVITDEKTHTTYVFPDEKYLQTCEELPELKGNTAKDLYLWGIDASTTYNKCADDKDVLAEWIKRFKKEFDK